MQIGEVARRSGVEIETIRYYEKIGLISPPPRSEGGHRVYGQDRLERLVFVRRTRQLGFSLDAVRTLLALVEGGYSCGEIQEIASRHLDDIRRKITDLQRIEATLSETLARCEGGAAPDCPIIDILSRSS